MRVWNFGRILIERSIMGRSYSLLCCYLCCAVASERRGAVAVVSAAHVYSGVPRQLRGGPAVAVPLPVRVRHGHDGYALCCATRPQNSSRRSLLYSTLLYSALHLISSLFPLWRSLITSLIFDCSDLLIRMFDRIVTSNTVLSVSSCKCVCAQAFGSV